VVHEVAAEEDFNRQDEREEQLMCFEQGTTDVLIQVECEMVVEALDALIWLMTLRAIVYTLAE